MVTRGSWSPQTPRVTPTRVCLQITGPLNRKLIFFRMNPIQFVNQKILPWNRWVDLCNRQRRPYSLFITLLSSIWIVVGTHSAKMITEENECIYLMSTVIRERKTSHLFIVLIVFPPYELINLRQLAFEIIFSLYEFLKPGPLEIVLLNPSNDR